MRQKSSVLLQATLNPTGFYSDTLTYTELLKPYLQNKLADVWKP